MTTSNAIFFASNKIINMKVELSMDNSVAPPITTSCFQLKTW